MRYFAVTTRKVYDNFVELGWQISTSPFTSPDAEQVMFDLDGNLDFSNEQVSAIFSAGGKLVPVDLVAIWLKEHGWQEDNPVA